MTWLFSYFVEEKSGYTYDSPSPWLNVEAIKSVCPEASFHGYGRTIHPLHKCGNHLKNFGLRGCLIVETPSDSEAVILTLMGDQVTARGDLSSTRDLLLQFILRDPDWDEINKLILPLDIHQDNNGTRRSDYLAISDLRRLIDKVAFEVGNFTTNVVSDDYVEAVNQFVEVSHQEIERVQTLHDAMTSSAAAKRRELAKLLWSYSTYIRNPDA